MSRPAKRSQPAKRSLTRDAKARAAHGHVPKRESAETKGLAFKRGEVWERDSSRGKRFYLIMRSSLVDGKVKVCESAYGSVFETSAEAFFRHPTFHAHRSTKRVNDIPAFAGREPNERTREEE